MKKMAEDKNKDIDEQSGVETTGHEWDGIKELNNPAPRWWLWVFYITIIWSVWYWAIYPSWPTISGEGERGGTVGAKEWTQYKKLADDQAEIRARKAKYMQRFKQANFDEILNDTELYAFAIAGGKTAFKDNCATCHGTGGAGSAGYPNLNDDDWIWGGKPTEIYKTLKFGIRSGHDEERYSLMPEFGELLTEQELGDVADYVLSLSGRAKFNKNGAVMYKENCASCHGEYGRGIRDSGAPNLADSIWFYGGERGDIISQMRKPKHGVMPAWDDRLDEETIRQLTIYVHSLGGGE